MTGTIDFDPPASGGGQEDASAVTAAVTRIAGLNARAVMPDGSTLDRAEILVKLGLNPNTAPTAWLTAIACGSNASALLPSDLSRIATDRVANASQVLRQVQQLSGEGFSSGGAAPS